MTNEFPLLNLLQLLSWIVTGFSLSSLVFSKLKFLQKETKADKEIQKEWQERWFAIFLVSIAVSSFLSIITLLA